VVETAAVPNPDEPGWTINGGGYHINHRFGFGALDVGKMVEAAQQWTTVPEQRVCHVEANNDEMPFRGGDKGRQHLKANGCRGYIDRLEHVQVHMDLEHNRRGDLSLTLTSPHGTSSQILSPRSNDDSSEGIRDWTFMTVHNWGEDPTGEWTLEVEDTGKDKQDNRGVLVRWAMTLYGVDASEYHNKNVGVDSGAVEMNKSGMEEMKHSVGEDDAHEASSHEVQKIMDKEREDSNRVNIKDTSGKKNGENKKTDEMISQVDDAQMDALAEFLLELGMNDERKKIQAEETAPSNNLETQRVHLRNLQSRLEEEHQEKLHQQKEQEVLQLVEELLEKLES